MSDTTQASSGSSKSAFIVGGIALVIVVIVFAVIGLGGGAGNTDNAPVMQPNQAHDESVPHSHAPAAPKPHDESVPHSH